MHAPGPYGRGPSSSVEDANGALLEAVDRGMAALVAYARDVERIARPDSEDIGELLGSAELQLDYVDAERARDLWLAIEGLRGQLDVAAARLAVAA